jgi:hypothetical protein
MSRKQPTPWAGKIVRTIRYLTSEELAREFWCDDQMVAALEFTDGSLVYAACDSEGNGPGALFGVTPHGQTLWISPAEDSGRKDA